jgi:hypothetical protein
MLHVYDQSTKIDVCFFTVVPVDQNTRLFLYRCFSRPKYTFVSLPLFQSTKIHVYFFTVVPGDQNTRLFLYRSSSRPKNYVTCIWTLINYATYIFKLLNYKQFFQVVDFLSRWRNIPQKRKDNYLSFMWDACLLWK